MIEQELRARFVRMEKAAPGLQAAFKTLTGAHAYFQGSGRLRSISVSDVLDNGSIEATFQGVRVKFEPLLVFGTDRRPRTRVLCLHCHCTFGVAVQDRLGMFSYGEDGITDLDPDHDGNFPRIDEQAPEIVLHFLDAALQAQRTL